MPKLVILGSGDDARLVHFYFFRYTPHAAAAFAVHGANRDLSIATTAPPHSAMLVTRRNRTW